MPKYESLDALEFAVLEAADASRWLVQVIRAGESANGNVYSPEVLREAVDLFEGRPLNVYDVGGGRTSHLPPKVQAAVKGGLIQAVVGVLTGVRWDDSRQAIVAEANITAPWFAETLQRIWAALSGGPIRTFGLSIAATVEAVREGSKRLIQRFRWVDSVDVVTSPAAGGEFVAALEAVAEGMQAMDEAKIRELIAEALKGLHPLTEARVSEIIHEALKGATTQAEAERAAVAKALQIAQEAKDEASRIVREANEARLQTRAGDLVALVMKGYAPETQAAAVRLVVSESKPEDTDDVIRGRVKAFADPLPKPTPAPRPGRVQVVHESADKMRLAMAGMMGVAEAAELEGVTPFRSLAQAYVQYTGNPEALYGEPFADLRRQGFDALRQGVTEDVQISTSFTVALGTSMHKRLLKAYRRPGWQERRLLSPKQELRNFKRHHLVRIGGFGDIPTVAEAGEYLTGTNPTEEAPYMEAAKKGRLFEVSWEKILADDLRVITREVDNLGHAARRTFAHAVFGMLHDNPTLWDGLALGVAGHANYTTDALAYASIIAGADALYAQTEQNSGEKMLIDVRDGGLLIIPHELDDTAYEIMSWDEKPGAATYGNRLRGMFGSRDNPMERVIEDPFTTDATNWEMLANPQEYDGIVPGYLFGKEEPELLSAEAEQAYAMWYKEVLQYKIRFIWALAWADYRPAYVAVVAG